jgi:large subunit ribosomal protein L20
MVRVTNAVASRKRTKKVFKKVKGFYGDRKNHTKMAKCNVMQAQKFATIHRKQRKSEFRSIWIQRINVAARMYGLSYSKLIHGLSKAGVTMDRKSMADLAVRDTAAFAAFAETAKKALV